MTLRSAFIETMSRVLDENENAVFLLGDISVYAFRASFEKHPDRCYNVGLTEQASVGLAAGLSIMGLYPVYHTIDPFLVRRAFEQVYLDFGVQKLHGMFVTVGGAKDYASLGATHQCAEGMKLMREVPGMCCYAPRKEDYVASLIELCPRHRALAYIRLEESNAQKAA